MKTASPICVDLGLWKTYHLGGRAFSKEEQKKETEILHQRLHKEHKSHIHIDGSFDERE